MNLNQAAEVLNISGLLTLEAIKQAYRRASSKYHPDKGGSTHMMQLVNQARDVLMQNVDRTIEDNNNDDHENYGDLMNRVINALAEFNELNLELCGSWLWIGGDTRQHKDRLKELQCRWAPKKKLWYFSNGERGKGRGRFDMDEIRARHGSKDIKTGKRYASIR